MSGVAEMGYWNISDVLPKLKGKRRYIGIWATSSCIFHLRKVRVCTKFANSDQNPKCKDERGTAQKSWGSVGARVGKSELPPF